MTEGSPRGELGHWPSSSPLFSGMISLSPVAFAQHGEAVLGFPVPARRSADSQRSALVVRWRAVHATSMPSTSTFQQSSCGLRRAGILLCSTGRVASDGEMGSESPCRISLVSHLLPSHQL